MEQVLPSRLRRRVQALQEHTTPLTAGGPAVNAEVLTVIAGACRDHQQLRFTYRSGADTRRLVEPLGLVHTGRRWYFVAWDVDRADWRTFRADRIADVPALAARFTPRTAPADDLAAYVSRSVASSVYTYQAVLVIHAPLEDVADRTSPTSVQLEEIDASSCLMRSGGESLDTMAFHLLHIGFEFDVLEPPELVERMRELSERLARSVSGRR
ncbi:WYL domain-containing protein [Lentzea tibetensis]|uniref:WYL domain-containing protein n=1 Tax=Lentzea tibetensis TaxID=2591470 RepID=A0A563EWT2_9PSEU|nr:WYL domain-containing protein [Lentzea tibetensis]